MSGGYLDVAGIETYYGDSHVLYGISIHVERGEVVALLGRNGAGKTTTLKSIMGLVPPRGGSVRFKGEELRGVPVHGVCRRGIGYVPEERRIFARLTVRENLDVARRPATDDRVPWTIARVLELFSDLKRFESLKAGALSGGQQQMLAIARTLMGNPELLLLDEPSEGLAPLIVRAVFDQIAELRRHGLSIVLCEQNLKFATGLADRAYVLERGEIKYEGTIQALQADDNVRRAHLMV